MSKKVYLAGPITGLSWESATDWRKVVKDKIHPGIRTYSPLRNKVFLSGEQKVAQSYEDYPLSSSKGINTRDYNDVKVSDGILVNFLGATKVSIGTVMEIAWARAFSIPVICVMEKDNIHNHIMLNYVCGYIVDNLDEV